MSYHLIHSVHHSANSNRYITSDTICECTRGGIVRQPKLAGQIERRQSSDTNSGPQ